MIHGTLAATVTPLRDAGREIDLDAIGPMVDFLAGSGLDGLFAFGTTGEGMLLEPEQRRAAAKRFREASAGRLDLAVHCGAMTTAGTVALAEHAASIGVDGVAVMPPPFVPLDSEALWRHFSAAARACAPTPFYVYEHEARAGYPVPIAVVARLSAETPNFRGLKVSNQPWERALPYLRPGLDVFFGAEALLTRGLASGIAGAISGLAAAFPEAVAAVMREPDEDSGRRLGELRSALQGLPFHAAQKRILALRGVPIRTDVRAPLRTLSPEEDETVRTILARWQAEAA